MVSLVTVPKAQEKLVEHVRARRLATGLTQAGLAKRAGVSLASLRKFEQKGLISLQSYLKILMALGILAQIVEATAPAPEAFSSIDDVLAEPEKKTRKKGWRT
jgi:transcriptional regulator with XRE-family HTH domain